MKRTARRDGSREADLDRNVTSQRKFDVLFPEPPDQVD